MVSGGPGSPQAPHYSRGVLRPSSLSRALAALGVGVLIALGASAGVPSSPAHAASAGPPDPTQPLVLRMRSITPDYIPDHGPITIGGTITNDSDEEWTAINVEGFFGSTPITTPAELAAAAQTPVDADVGHRIAEPGTFAHLDSLQPGQVGTVHGPAAALAADDLDPGRLLVRRPRPRRHRGRSQLQRCGARPHLPAARARLGDGQRAGGADLTRAPGAGRGHPRPGRHHRGHRAVAPQPADRRAARPGDHADRRPGADH